LLDGEAQISQFQLLSHQSKISYKVEIFIGRGASYRTAVFSRLGYLSLDSNERSNFQSRELKTVFIDNVYGEFIKLIINENHVNKTNLYNQVGIVAVSLLGMDEAAVAASKQGRFPVGAGHKGGPRIADPYNDLSVDLNLDPQTADKLRQLAEAKSRAVEQEDYGTAKQIKNVEQELKAMGSQLAQLDMAKSDAVIAEDYDLAKEIKDSCDSLRREIETKVRFFTYCALVITFELAFYFIILCLYVLYLCCVDHED
jgi:centrosomal protein CEP104